MMYKARRSSNPYGLCDLEGKIKAFRSQFEDRFAYDLCRRGIDFRYERPVDRIAWVKPATEHVYSPDFVVIRSDGHRIYCELKGRLDSDSMVKMALVVKQRPDLDIRMVFQNCNSRAGRTKRTAASWSDKHGIRWCERLLPESWLELGK